MHQPGLTASLASFDLLDLVQAIHMDRRALSLVVRNGTQSVGVLHFSQGELLWAEFQGMRGDEAFIALAAQKMGSIEQLPWDGQGERNVAQPLSRLIMQAASHRDTHGERQAQRSSDQEQRRQQTPSYSNGSGPAQAREHAPGAEHQSHHHSGHTPPPHVLLPDDDLVPAWVREIRGTSGPISMQRTDILPPKPAVGASVAAAAPPPLDAAPDNAAPAEESGAPMQPTLPLSALNGKMNLPSLGNGNRVSHQLPPAHNDPPTVPLPSVPGGLLDYAPRREPLAQLSPVDATPKTALKLEPPPLEAVTVRAASASVASMPPPSPAPADAEVPAEVPSLPSSLPEVSGVASSKPATGAPPLVEAKLSSLSILEQLAYGSLSSTAGAEQTERRDEAASGTLERAPQAPPKDVKQPQQSPPDVKPLQQSPTDARQPQASPADVKPLRQVLESFVEQVGPACLATALVRTDGSLVADYMGRRSQGQELTSPAYHLAHVMQSSLRALLMGGWGDLEETMITGSTHLVVLRRLGRPENGLFHVAVLERSGNPGLCRVRMRGSESALLQCL